jgi:tRNA A-37 threonylcarbamoyl transferase component Bud32
VNTDRNLLFGVLALQADLLTAAQFAEACAAWAARKDGPLAALLVERGWLTPSDRVDVDKLLERKLARHGGNVQASLAEATTDRARHSLAGIADPAVQQSLAGLTPSPAGHVLLTTINQVPESRDRYSLSRLHATGGLGRVWLARDESLGRDVALKELRPERAGHPSIWARFLKEAQITGQLEHPGIVPVYELSRRSAEEQPFYTMRFVRGRTLAETARAYHERRGRGEAGPLELRDLLAAFVGVCNAVAYAHSRGVIHRDLKPQNVVLGDFGEVMVLDWGLAKVIGEAEPAEADRPALALEPSDAADQTAAGQVLGTPAYMAPEQAEGRLDLLGPATDVYGLGTVLYELLSGKAPFGGDDTQTVLGKVIHEPPAPPRVHNPRVPAALAAVCLKALAKKPQERYATAQDLAAEVKHWLADEPVAAYPEPLPVRAGRWVRRHRTLVTTAAAVLVVGAVSLLAATVLLANANEEIRSKNQALAAANEEIRGKNEALAAANVAVAAEAKEKERQRQSAVASEKQAVAARQQAVVQRKQAVDALLLFAEDFNTYCNDAMVPGASKNKLYENLRAQLERQLADDGDKEFNADKAWFRISQYRSAAMAQIETGRSRQAQNTLQQALKLADQWVAARPGDPVALRDRSTILRLFALSNRNLLNLEAAQRYFAEALEILDKLWADRKLSRSQYLFDAGDILDDLERWEEALAMRKEAHELDLKRIRELKLDPERALHTLDRLNWTYQKAAGFAGSYPKQKEYLDKTNETSAALIALRKGNRAALDRWAKNLRLYAWVEERQGEEAARAGQDARAKEHRAAAQKQLVQLVEVTREMATSDDLLKARQAFADALYDLARFDKALGHQPSAEAHARQCIALREEILRDYPKDIYAQMSRVKRLFPLVLLGRHAEATAEAEVMLVKFADKMTLSRLGWLYALCIPAVAQGRRPAALTAEDKALQEAYRTKAVECLDQAVKAGFDEWDRLRHDMDLDPLRGDPRFQKILKRAKGD